MDALYIDPDTVDIRTWLEKRGLADFTKAFEKHKVDFEILGDLTYEDIKEIGIVEVGPRRKVYRAISRWREERDVKKAEVIRQKMAALDEQQMPARPTDMVDRRLLQLRHTMGQVCTETRSDNAVARTHILISKLTCARRQPTPELCVRDVATLAASRCLIVAAALGR